MKNLNFVQVSSGTVFVLQGNVKLAKYVYDKPPARMGSLSKANHLAWVKKYAPSHIKARV